MIFLIAWRNIWRNSTRSIIIILSVVIGLLAGIAVVALYKGLLHSRLRTVIETETGHIQLHHLEFKKDYESIFILPGGYNLLSQIMAIPGVQMAAPRSVTHGMLSTATGSSGVQINGVDPQSEYKISQLKMKIKEGNGFTSGKKNQIIISKKLADKVRLKTGAKLVLTLNDSSGNIVTGAFRVCAIYSSDNARLDETNVYVTINDLGNLLGIETSFHEITILLNHDDHLEQVMSTLREKYPGYLVESWKDLSPETELMVKTMDTYSFITLSIIMLALAFGIINTMLMAILERTREIGMMVALGMTRIRLFLLILMETIFLTLAGVPVAIFLSWLITGYYSKYGLDLSVFGEEMLSNFGYSTVVYPEFPWDNLTAILLIVGGTALLSCVFPAIRGLRLQPVETLRR